MGTEKRQRAIAKRLKRKEAREERKARERKTMNARVRAARQFIQRNDPARVLLMAAPTPLPSSTWHNIVRKLGL
jgi:hypothetical protein